MMRDTKGAPIKLIELRVFCTDELPGSPQFMHIFAGLEEMQSAFDRYTVMDEYDHSFVYFESPECASVRWKNRSGLIGFCGAGAYGLSWLSFWNTRQKVLQIKSDSISISSTANADGVELKFPALATKLLGTDNGESLYTNANSGIFLLKTNEPIKSKDVLWLFAYLRTHPIKNIHGFCVFSWDQENLQGKVRYFVPWHGRNEDYVTGSIHRYLTPLVYDLFDAQVQTWVQVSNFAGRVVSHCDGSEVSLSGQCRIHAVL